MQQQQHNHLTQLQASIPGTRQEMLNMAQQANVLFSYFADRVDAHLILEGGLEA